MEKSDLQEKGTQITTAFLNSLSWDYLEANTNKKEEKHYSSVIHLPLVSNNLNKNTPVIEVLPPTELHLLIGPLNTLHDALKKAWPRSEGDC